jgi:hypothetical protein
MYRVGTTSDNTDLLTSAFEDGKDRATLVVMNRSTSSQQISVDWKGKHWTQIERTNPYSENATSMQVSPDEVVQPGEIVVLSTFAVN